MTLEKESLVLLKEALERLEESFQNLPEFEPSTDRTAVREVLLEVAERMQDNYPFYHPFYIGQMVKQPPAITRLAYALSLWINPNNHAFEGGPASSIMEKEAVAEIAQMVGWKNHLGHLTSGGTMANLESLWVAGRLAPGKTVVASGQAHYTHERICGVLGLDFQAVSYDCRARMDVDALKQLLDQGNVGTVVVTLGTSATGSVDPLPAILELQAQYGFRIHADAAYGGYFSLADNLTAETQATFKALPGVDSIAIDPHKHGLQPFGCGCVLFQDPAIVGFYQHDSPYTYFGAADLHLGEISLECSRSGAAAVALWATQRWLPLVPGGQFANNLSQARRAALMFVEKIQQDSRLMVIFPPELDIVVWAPRDRTGSRVSQLSRAIFQAAAAENLYLAVVQLPQTLLAEAAPEMEWDCDRIACLRCCLMKPEHLDWLDRIWQTLESILDQVLQSS